jgi:hypothetical protein
VLADVRHARCLACISGDHVKMIHSAKRNAVTTALRLYRKSGAIMTIASVNVVEKVWLFEAVI